MDGRLDQIAYDGRQRRVPVNIDDVPSHELHNRAFSGGSDLLSDFGQLLLGDAGGQCPWGLKEVRLHRGAQLFQPGLDRRGCLTRSARGKPGDELFDGVRCAPAPHFRDS